LKSNSTKPLRLLGSMHTLPNFATISLIPLAISVVTNMSLGTGVSTTPNPALNRDCLRRRG
jgi:hypothetical protein